MGKSSLCRAGMLPRVEEGVLSSDRRWPILTFLPGRHPVQAMAAVLAPRLSESAGELARRLMQQPERLADALAKALGRDRGLVLFIDQMEELISQSSEIEAAVIGKALGGLTDRLRTVRLLATARSDFLARLATLPALGD